MSSAKLPHKKYIVIAAIAFSLVVSLPLSALLIPKAVAQTTHEVKISGFAFIPQNLTISPGDTIKWNNTDPVIHTLWFVYVSNGSTHLLSDPIAPSATWTHTFNDPVELQYYSFDRLWITGFINVSAAVPDVAVVNLTSCHGSTVLAQNRTFEVDVTVTNEGATPETFTLTVYWNATNYIDSAVVTLAIAETKLVVLEWNTTGCQRYANYTLSAHATPVPGEIDTADNTFIDPRDLVITYPGDINNDKKVDIKDIAPIAKLFGVNCPDPRYDPNKDITCDCKIDIKDIAIAARNFGYIEP